MKRWIFGLGALVALALFVLPGSARAVRVGEPQRLAVSQTMGTNVDSSLAVDDQGGLWVWGYNHNGALGLTYTYPEMEDYRLSHQSQHTPVKLMDDVTWVACGVNFSAAIKKDGTLWMWGDNSYGQLGTGGRNNKGLIRPSLWGSGELSIQYQDEPMKVMADVAAISCAGQSVAVIKTDGTLWTWGENNQDQLGNGGKGSERESTHIRYKSTPVKIMDDVAAVSMGDSGAAAVKTDGTLWVWGRPFGGQFADGKLDTQSDHPIQVGEGYRDVAFGQTCLGIKEDGSLWGWGEATYGGLAGNVELYDKTSGRHRYQTTPVKLMDNVKRAYTTHTTFCTLAAIREDNSLWVWGDKASTIWGDNTPGPMGLPKKDGVYPQLQEPTKLLDGVEHLAMYQYALALREDGTLWSWGLSDLGRIYDPATGAIGEYLDTDDRLWQTPVQIPAQVLDLAPGAKAEVAVEPEVEAGAPEVVTAGIDPQDVGVAHPAVQPLEIRDEHVELAGYALWDSAGGVTTYVRLRDLAWLLNGTAAQFDVGYGDGRIALTSNAPYSAPNGTEGRAPFQADQPYTRWRGPTAVDGRDIALQAFVLTDAQGGGHTYYKLRDLGQALGFNVGWSAQRGMYLEPDKPYSSAD